MIRIAGAILAKHLVLTEKIFLNVSEETTISSPPEALENTNLIFLNELSEETTDASPPEALEGSDD